MFTGGTLIFIFVGWNKQRGSTNRCDNGESTSFDPPYT